MNKKSFVIIFAIFLLVGTFGFVSADNKLQIWRNKTTGVNVSWIDNDGNFYGFGNVSAANFIGSGQYLTDLNVSAMDLSDYVPYTGANQNLVLGDNNFSVGGSDLFVDGGTGRVGIGTGGPDAKLEVVGVDDGGYSNVANLNGLWHSMRYIDTGGQYYWQVGNAAFDSPADFRITGPANSPMWLVMKSTGEVGVNTASPQRTLHVNGDILSNATINATGDICIEGGICLSDAGTGSGNVQGTGVVNRAAFWTAGDTLGYDGNFTWDNTNKRLGIGTSTPQSKLNINGTLGSLAGGLTFGDGDTGFYEIADDQLYFNVAGSNIFKFMSSGMQGQGTNYFYIKNSPASSIVPPYTFRNDEDTGLGKAGDDKLSLIAGGVEGLRITTTNLTANNNMYVIGSLNATGDVCSSGGCLNDVVSGSVNANSSNYWDGLDTPSDILGSEINNDLNWINASEGVIVLGNWSADKDDYYTKLETYNQSEVDDMITSGTVNNSDLLDGYDSNFFMPLNTSVHGDFDFNGGWTDDGVSIVDGDIYAQAGYFYQINSLQVSTLEVNGSLIPDLDNSFDVGNSTLGWRNGYFTGDVVADSFVGDGSGLTNLNVSNIDLSDYVPYTGADKNLDLGNNNFSVGGNALFVNANTGKVGVGTGSPTAKLSFEPENYLSGTPQTSGILFQHPTDDVAASVYGLRVDNQGMDLVLGSNFYHTGVTTGRYDTTEESSGILIGRTGRITFYTGGTGASATGAFAFHNSGGIAIGDSYYLQDAGNDNLIVEGNVGIGTTTPQNKLNVIGDINATGLIYGDGSQLTNLNLSGVNGSTQWKDNGNDIYYNDGNVGIGTTTPQSKLNINGTLGSLAGGLTFGDGDSGIYELIDDLIRIEANGNAAMYITSSEQGVQSSLSTSWGLRNEGATSTVASITPNRNDGNTGIGSAGADQLSLIAGGVEQLRLIQNDTSNDIAYFVGNVGIGTTTPQNALNVIGDGNFTGNVYGSFIGDGSQLTNLNLSGVNGSTQWLENGNDIYYNDGNVGIGTDDPGVKLEVSGNTIVNGYFKINDSSNQIRLVDSDGDQEWRLSANANLFLWEDENTGKFPFSMKDGAETNSLVISTGNQVGIGTGSPKNALNVIGDGNFTGDLYSNGNLVGTGNVSGTGAANRAAFWTSNDELNYDDDFVWDNTNKRLGIGIASPQEELHVNGSLMLSDNTISMENISFDAETSVGMRLTNPNGYVSITPLNTGWAHIYTDRAKFIFNKDLYVIGGKFASYSTADLTLSAGGDSNDLVINNTNGNIGIGTTTPQNKLNVIGDINATGTIYGASFDGVESYWNQSGDYLYPANLSKNVGIGIANPSKKLDVNGSINIPTTTSSDGIIFQDGNKFIHSYSPTGSNGRNIFIGKNSGSFTTSWTTGNQGAENVAVGEDSLNSMTTGYRNSVFGFNAGTSVTTGYANNMIGTYSGNAITIGNSNNLQGYFAGGAITTGNNNIALGESALRFNQIGSGNVALGYRSLFGASGQSHTYNTGIGYQSGYGITTGNYNIFLGYQAGDLTTSGSNNIIIGKNIDTSSAIASNELNIGNTIYGDLSLGNVGIGTTTPQNELNVIGDINATGYIVGDGSQLSNLNVSNIDLSDYVPYTGADKNVDLGNNNFSVGGTDLFVNSNTGFVGIGTDVQPDSKTFFSVYRATENANIRVASGNAGAFSSIQMLSGGTHWELGTQGTFANGNLIIRPSSSGNSDMFNFVNTGRFGIGTSTPQNELNVIGDINATGLIYGNGSQLTGISAGLWSENGADIYYDDGNVGIGTISPTAKLEVNGTAKITGSMIIGETNITTEVNGDVQVW